MPLHLDPFVKGRWIKLGSLGWVKLGRILRADIGLIGKRHVLVYMKAGGPPLRCDTSLPDQVKAILDREAGKD